MTHTIKTQISDHPLISTNSQGQPIGRYVQFLGYAGFDLLVSHVVLRFSVTLESPMGTVVATPTELEYRLHTDVWFNSQGEVVPTGSPDAVVTEYDYWLGQMVNEPVADGALILTGIQNLDTNFQFFDQI